MKREKILLILLILSKILFFAVLREVFLEAWQKKI